MFDLTNVLFYSNNNLFGVWTSSDPKPIFDYKINDFRIQNLQFERFLQQTINKQCHHSTNISLSPTIALIISSAYVLVNNRDEVKLSVVPANLLGFLSTLMPIMSLYLILVICIARMIGIVKPLRYKSLVTFRVS